MDNTVDHVLCYGILCVDQIVRTDAYPPPDGHARILEEGRFVGGEAANSAVALTRLGVSVILRGNFVGADERGRFLLENVRTIPNLECSGIVVKPGFQTPYAVIVSSQDGHRTILGSFAELQSPPLTEEDFEGIRLLSVDPFLGDHALRVAESAKARGLPVVSIEVDPASAMVKYCDVAINSRGGFIQRHRMGKPEEVGARLVETGVETAVITQGADGCLVFDAKEGVFSQSAFDVPVVDSTGAGDAFRAGFIYGRLRQWELRAVVRFASAVAGLNCRGIGACTHAPCLEEVEHFLEGS